MRIQDIAHRLLKTNKHPPATLPTQEPETGPAKVPASFQPPAMVLLDDNEMFLTLLSLKLSKKRSVACFQNPHDFLARLEAYPKSTIICFDYDFKLPDLDGLQLGMQLHQRGYTRLYMVSGMSFSQDQYPAYITLVDKCNVDVLDKIT